jgi:predicted esterase
MHESGVNLNGIDEPWADYSISEYGRLACAQKELASADVLIGHSVGAIAALSVVQKLPIRRLLLCSPSALFAEDIAELTDSSAADFLGEKRYNELSRLSSYKLAEEVNQLGHDTVITIGSKEYHRNLNLVQRAKQLSESIHSSRFIEISGAEHSIRDDVYASEISRIVTTICE